MNQDLNESKSNFQTGIITSAAIVIVLAGVKIAAPIIVPFLLAGFIALICSIPLFWLNKKGVPGGLSIALVIMLLVFITVLLGTTIGSSVNSFYANLPEYKNSLKLQTADLLVWIQKSGIDISSYSAMTGDIFDASMAVDIATTALQSLSEILANGFLILLTVIFIMLEAVYLPKKLTAALANPTVTFEKFEKFLTSVKQYLFIKSIISLITGLFVGIWLWILNVDFPVLWGLFAFALNFVPNIGSIIAAVPPLLLSLVQHGPVTALWVGICFLIVNIVMGSIIEPRVMGKGVGLSTLVVFLSLVFWGWLLGPIGMLLSVPLTMIVKIGCQTSTSLKHIGVLLGPADGDD